MSETYTRRMKVMFQHCDPAGIVFYPRYVEMLNATVEDWFDEVVGVPFAAMQGPRRIGVPTAHLAVDFRRPSRLGDVLDFTLAVARLGRSSVELRIAAHGPEGLRLEAALTLVHVGMDSLKPAPWPEDIRARIAPLARKGSD